MKLLLDAHTLIWAVDDPAKLGVQATAALQDPANDLLLSAGSIWELAIKLGLGKLTLSLPFRQWMNQALDDPDDRSDEGIGDEMIARSVRPNDRRFPRSGEVPAASGPCRVRPGGH